MNWFLRGVKKGVKTEDSPGAIAPWTTELRRKAQDGAREGNEHFVCPTSAIEATWRAEKCIFCRRCQQSYTPSGTYRLGQVKRVERSFKRSFYLYPIDIGSCGGCNLELRLISSPQYDMTRFGIFFTNTPRHADALVVMGIMTEGMREAYMRAYDAMPEPKLVIALGACAISGGIFGSGIPDPDVVIPGCPPAPYTILDALVRAKGGEGW